MKINYKISLTIVITAFLHIVGLAAYIFDLIPVQFHKVYFYNLDRIYIILLMLAFYILSVDKILKKVLLLSFSIHLIYTIIVNIKYFVTLSSEVSEKIWILTISGSMLACLIALFYVTRK